MNQIHRSVILVILFILSSISLSAQTIDGLLQQLPQIDSVRMFGVSDSSFQAFELFITQAIEHNDPEGETYSQRLILRHRGFDKPMVFVTEGYAADYALWADYTEELAELLDANLLVAEHSFFSQSLPDHSPWKSLTQFNVANDLHQINQTFKQFYKLPWISTGISKGGQTAYYYKYYFPDDVSATVSYVAPLNFSATDKTVFHFLDTVGDQHCREKIKSLQKDLLSRRSIYYRMFSDSVSHRNLTFSRLGGMEKAFEYNVLEFGFAYWQWYPVRCENLPDVGGDTLEIFRAFIDAAGYDFFADQSIADFQPFFYQALTEMGMYTYDMSDFRGMIKHIDTPGFTHALPEGTNVKFNKKLNKKVRKWLKKKGNNMIFIYGGYDAWSATAVQTSSKTNALKLVLPGGSHTTRLTHFDDKTQTTALELLRDWIGSVKE